MAGALRTLELAFARPEALRHEYETNLANGGVFIATGEVFELREKVRVRLRLGFCHERLEIAGEVVHRVTAEMAALGRTPQGVAISFEEPAATRPRSRSQRRCGGGNQSSGSAACCQSRARTASTSGISAAMRSAQAGAIATITSAPKPLRNAFVPG